MIGIITGGPAFVPFLHAGVVNEYDRLIQDQFLDAVVITVGLIGYLVNGFYVAAIAVSAPFLSCSLLTSF